MPHFFISYRHDDTGWAATALADQLRKFANDPASNIFLDANSIPAGSKFFIVLEEKIHESAAVLVLIGPDWLASSRLHDPEDIVRFEIATSLQSDAVVIPVLVDNTPMPSAKDLPNDVKPLTERQVFRLTRGRITKDVEDLIDQLDLESIKKRQRLRGALKRARVLLEKEIERALRAERLQILKQRKDDANEQRIQTIDRILNSKEKASLSLNIDKSIQQLDEWSQESAEWANSIAIKNAQRSKNTASVFVELDTYLIQSRYHISDSEKENRFPLKNHLDKIPHHAVVLGHAGAGKTTAMKKLLLDIIDRNKRPQEEYRFPLSIPFRALSGTAYEKAAVSLIHRVTDTLDYSIRFQDDVLALLPASKRDEIASETGLWIFDNLAPILLLDGYDEIADDTKKLIDPEIDRLFDKCRYARIILTCRNGQIMRRLPQAIDFEIAPLSEEQISSLVNNWLNNDSSTNDVVNAILRGPLSGPAIRPLNVANICAIYERTRKIPDEFLSLYQILLDLLLEAWDKERGLERVTKFFEFDGKKKGRLLRDLAFDMRRDGARVSLTVDQFEKFLVDVRSLYQLESTEAEAILEEVERNTGILVCTAGKRYEFFHRRIQEYLSAEFISRSGIPKDREILVNLAPDIAISVAMAASPSRQLAICTQSFRRHSLDGQFARAFMDTLLEWRPSLARTEDDVFNVLACCSLLVGPSRHNSSRDLPKSPTQFEGLREYVLEALDRLSLKSDLRAVRARYNTVPFPSKSDLAVYQLKDKSQRHFPMSFMAPQRLGI